LSYFGKKASRAQRGYRDFVESLLGQEYETPLKDVVNSTFLGSVDFVNEIKDKFLKDKKADRNLPLLRQLATSPAIDQIEKAMEWVVGGNEALSKQLTLFFSHRYSGRKLKEIGARFKIGESAVSQASRRVSMKMKTDKSLMKRIKLIEKELNLSKV
jgi:putative transposase